MRTQDKALEERLRTYGKTGGLEAEEERLCRAVRGALRAFEENQEEYRISYFEFLFQQAWQIRKRWWALQGGALWSLWEMLSQITQEEAQRRLAGVFIPLFALMILPELWKNVRYDSCEVENAAYYTLRQVYSARLLLFAGVDLLLLSVFFGASAMFLAMSLEQLLYQFALPFLITCCIWFTALCSKRDGEERAIGLSIFFSGLWSLVIMKEGVYEAVSKQVWEAAVVVSLLYLGYAVYRLFQFSERKMEVEIWN